MSKGYVELVDVFSESRYAAYARWRVTLDNQDYDVRAFVGVPPQAQSAADSDCTDVPHVTAWYKDSEDHAGLTDETANAVLAEIRRRAWDLHSEFKCEYPDTAGWPRGDT